MNRALLVGIDHYENFNDLSGCVNDAEAMLPLLERNEDASRNIDCKVLSAASTTAGRVDRAMLDQNIDKLLGPGADFALLYFAGHGDAAHNDVTLVTTDGTSTAPGIRFTEVLEKIQRSKVAEVVVVLDCCYSGGAGNVPAIGGGAVLRPGVSILAASRPDQLSAELDGRGAFSQHLEGALAGGAADVLGQVTVAGLYAYVSESFDAWNQRPTFKANIERLHVLRQCRAAVGLDMLRELPKWFPTPHYEFPLDPTYEPDAGPDHVHLEHEGVFAGLQICRAAKLVEPVGFEHMYFAAMNSGVCRLTPLGRHYRHMAAEGNL
ncbi:caspase family protein [Kribbella speibonae]|uniref:Caspase family protein n=2 Tax=Kribbella speibonae TaxID=1572660 RepID=A0A4R0IS13_9ACTN|nr:caspase family protein [Kribbella speibonae]